MVTRRPQDLYYDTVTLSHQLVTPEVDALGNRIRKWIRKSIRANIQQVAGITTATGVTYTARGYIDPDVEIAEDDAIIHCRREYWVNAVQYHRTPSGDISYISLDLRETQERRKTITS